ncbi:flagellin domain-containing protein, partial [Clostridium sartagoforme AAU1]
QKSNTGTYSTADRANVAEEMTALAAEITNITSNTKFNGASAMAAATIIIDDTGNSLVIGAASLNLATGANSVSTAVAIDSAIDQVNTERAKYGALQNRLEHIVNNLGTTTENLQASESRIRDVDMAKEMMNFSKNNILSQAAQAMLAQANQQPQGVLQLLR